MVTSKVDHSLKGWKQSNVKGFKAKNDELFAILTMNSVFKSIYSLLAAMCWVLTVATVIPGVSWYPGYQFTTTVWARANSYSKLLLVVVPRGRNFAHQPFMWDLVKYLLKKQDSLHPATLSHIGKIHECCKSIICLSHTCAGIFIK